jgi:hypothetical protein
MVNEEELEREELGGVFKVEVVEVVDVIDVVDVFEVIEVFEVMEELALTWCGSTETVCNSCGTWVVGAAGGGSSAVSPTMSPAVSPAVSPTVSPVVAGGNFFWPVVALGEAALSCCRSS